MAIATRNHRTAVDFFLGALGRAWRDHHDLGTQPTANGASNGAIGRESIAINPAEAEFLPPDLFLEIVTREDEFDSPDSGTSPSRIRRKPSGDPVRVIGRRLGAAKNGDPCSEVLMVGDHSDDVKCGKDAGAFTCEVIERGATPFLSLHPDIVVSSLGGLLRYL